MRKVFSVAKWEYLEKVKTKAFLIFMILFPVILVGMAFIPALLRLEEESETKAFGFIECNISIFTDFVESIEEYKTKNNQPSYIFRKVQNSENNCEANKSSADKFVFDKKIDGYVLIKQVATDSVIMEFRGENVSNVKDINRFENKLNQIISERKIISAGLSPELVESFRKKFEIKPVKISKSGEEKETSFMETFWSSYIFVLLLMMMIIFTGGMLVRSVVEEKSNRIIEVLVSSCTADQLMAGKIIGLSALGLTQIIVWGLLGIAISGPVGASFINLENLILIFIYFALGYVFYAAIFVAIGSLANTEQEAQQFTSYVSLILVIPIMLSFQIMNEPNSDLVKILSYIPFTTAPIMTMKINIVQPPLIEFILTIGVMLVGILIVIFIAGKIFRVGILSYGKSPKLKEIFYWIISK
ncbi:MAG: ABC transporter permease [Bacteroidetes bacterium]|nr:ABC transporter permease [Bacteroidota bacterium]MBU2584215.1 ABC transporter permease [Bacteroidota bacterium]